MEGSATPAPTIAPTQAPTETAVPTETPAPTGTPAPTSSPTPQFPEKFTKPVDLSDINTYIEIDNLAESENMVAYLKTVDTGFPADTCIEKPRIHDNKGDIPSHFTILDYPVNKCGANPPTKVITGLRYEIQSGFTLVIWVQVRNVPGGQPLFERYIVWLESWTKYQKNTEVLQNWMSSLDGAYLAPTFDFDDRTKRLELVNAAAMREALEICLGVKFDKAAQKQVILDLAKAYSDGNVAAELRQRDEAQLYTPLRLLW